MSRRTEIADAAIATLAREGMRGLTHRAVDHAAGVPEGSTSYYFRTRAALLETLLERLVELDEQELAQRPESPNDVVDFFAELLNRWATTGRDRQLARYELVLESTRRPELRPALAKTQAQLREILADGLRDVMGAEALDIVHQIAGPLDGLLLYQVASGQGPLFSSGQIADLIRRLGDWTTAHRGGSAEVSRAASTSPGSPGRSTD